jgi:hypothetical protein
MHRSLPAPWDLVKDSWSAFVQTWDTTVRYSSWIILAGIIQGLPAFLRIPEGDAQVAAMLITGAIAVALSFWVTNAVYLVVLALEKKEHVSSKTIAPAATLILPLILIQLWSGVALLGALVLFILPGIYVWVRIGFAHLELYTKGTRGRAALKASWDLTKDRFWPIVGRWVAGGALFGLCVIIAMTAATLIVQLVAGKEVAAMMQDENNAMGQATLSVISGIVQAAVLPLLVIFEVKLYSALKHSHAS